MQIRRPFQSTRTHHPSWSETEHDAISPCSSEKHISETFSTTAGPVRQQQQQQQQHHTYTDTIRASSPTDSSHDSSGSNTSSRRPSASAEADDVRELWAVMLGLQQRYRCYNSTRMQIAADSESAVEMMRKPSHRPPPAPAGLTSD